MGVFLCVGITQDRIDECRGAKEMAMLADVQALVQSGSDLNAQDDNGVTLVRQGHILFRRKNTFYLYLVVNSINLHFIIR